MKSEQEIRNHLKDLIFARQSPCDCRGTAHQLKCFIGGKMMDSAIETMRWILGENPVHQELVDKMAGEVRDRVSRG